LKNIKLDRRSLTNEFKECLQEPKVSLQGMKKVRLHKVGTGDLSLEKSLKNQQ